MQHQENADWHMARSHIYGLLGSLLSEQPVSDNIAQLLRPEAVNHLENLFADPQIGTQFHRLADQYHAGKISTEQVTLDFEWLMRVPGASYTHPYESVYRNRRKGETSLKWGGLCGRYARDAERCYLREGLAPQFDRVDFADHIGAELSFMAHICRETAEALHTGRPEVFERLQTKQQQFAQSHLLTWAEDFSEELRAKAVTPFFQAVADMLAAFVKLEKSETIAQ